MPFIEAASSRGVKRKRSQPTKNATSRATSRTANPHVDAGAEIERLEDEIKQSRKNYNNLVALLGHAFPSGSKRCNDAAILALSRCFGRILVDGALSPRHDMTDGESAILVWLQKKYAEFTSLLLSLIARGDRSSNLDVLKLAMRLVKQEVLSLGVKQWADGLFAAVLEIFLRGEGHALQIRLAFVESYYKYDDIRCHLAAILPSLLETLSSASIDPIMADNALTMLLAYPPVPASDADVQTLLVARQSDQVAALSRKVYVRKVQDAWLSIFQLRLIKRQRKRLLGLLVHQIVPWFSHPERFMDFLTDCYNEGGETTLLALNGLFHLMQEKNLDYPSFFTKLYSLLDDDVLHSKHRSRFFRLLDTFMASTHLPAALVASFIKRLCRLSLFAPPSAIVVVVPWIYNMFQRHPSTTFMMHRMARCEEEKQEWDLYGAEDPFDMAETDPMSTGAIDSSIWELVTLQSHFHPNVATLAKILSEQFTKQQYNLEDFLDHSYDSLIDVELEKTLKRSAVVEYVIPQTILRSEAESQASLGNILQLVLDAADAPSDTERIQV